MDSKLPKGDSRREAASSYYDKAFRRHAEIDGHYSGTATHSHMMKILWVPALKLVEPPILDLGCGPGQVAWLCVQQGIPYLLGVDFSPVAIRMARRLVPSVHFRVANVVKRAQDPTFPDFFDGGYRTVVLLEFLEHIYNDLAVLSRVPSGRRTIISVPNFDTEGHVRWFDDEDEVVDRYSELIDIQSMTICHPEQLDRATHRWFLFDGVRR